MTAVEAPEPSRAAAPQPLRATFILRLVREPTIAERAEWRGTLEHVQSGERRAVPDAASAAALVTGWLHALEEVTSSQLG
jgi:hypothetical protein